MALDLKINNYSHDEINYTSPNKITIKATEATLKSISKIDATADKAKSDLHKAGQDIKTEANKVGKDAKEAAAKGASKVEDAAKKLKEDLNK